MRHAEFPGAALRGSQRGLAMQAAREDQRMRVHVEPPRQQFAQRSTRVGKAAGVIGLAKTPHAQDLISR
ncbi:hypothetical protein D3C72_1990240 [compost metagenome]